MIRKQVIGFTVATTVRRGCVVAGFPSGNAGGDGAARLWRLAVGSGGGGGG